MAAETITPAGMRIIRLLAGGSSRTICELMQETGVTRTAVTEQLQALVKAGFVERTIEPLSGRGRPRHRYATTQAALVLLFARNQQVIVPAIWQAIRAAGGDSLTATILHGVSKSLADHYQAKITAADPQSRLEQYARILEAEGALVDLAIEEEQIVVKRRSCPFLGMFEEERSGCDLDLALMTEIAGCPVRQTSCRHDGDNCCRFEVDARNAPEPKAVCAIEAKA